MAGDDSSPFEADFPQISISLVDLLKLCVVLDLHQMHK